MSPWRHSTSLGPRLVCWTLFSICSFAFLMLSICGWVIMPPPQLFVLLLLMICFCQICFPLIVFLLQSSWKTVIHFSFNYNFLCHANFKINMAQEDKKQVSLEFLYFYFIMTHYLDPIIQFFNNTY